MEKKKDDEIAKKKRKALDATAMYRAIKDMALLVYPNRANSIALQLVPTAGDGFNVFLYMQDAEAKDLSPTFDDTNWVSKSHGDTIEAALSGLLELQREKIEEVRRQRLKEFDDVLSGHAGVVRAARHRANK